MQEIRELRISDYDSLMDLILGIYVEYPSALHFSSRPTEAEISALLVAKIAAIETGNGVDLVMIDGDRIIGECEVFKSDGCAFLGIIVGKGVRRMGVGTRLVRECLKRCAEIGIDKVYATVDKANRASIEFLLSNGFAYDDPAEADLVKLSVRI